MRITEGEDAAWATLTELGGSLMFNNVGLCQLITRRGGGREREENREQIDEEKAACGQIRLKGEEGRRACAWGDRRVTGKVDRQVGKVDWYEFLSQVWKLPLAIERCFIYH